MVWTRQALRWVDLPRYFRTQRQWRGVPRLPGAPSRQAPPRSNCHEKKKRPRKKWWIFGQHIVDGQNPAPPRMMIIHLSHYL